jgi:hypothetical protein
MGKNETSLRAKRSNRAMTDERMLSALGFPLQKGLKTYHLQLKTQLTPCLKITSKSSGGTCKGTKPFLS